MIWTVKIWAALALTLTLGLTLAMPVQAQSVSCETLTHRGVDFTVCEVDATQGNLRLFHSAGDSDRVLGSFSRVNDALAGEGLTLLMAMNAGMYHNDLSPVGLYVENGQEKRHIVTSDGPGNFGLLPNGVFCIRGTRADVIESLTFVDQGVACDYATQSGPMLVIDGKLHPRFLESSDSRYVRNGVGTSQDGQRVLFAISDQPVNFYTFGTLFRDVLKMPNALYFDGKVSRLYAPDINRHDPGFPMGPIVGVVGAAE